MAHCKYALLTLVNIELTGLELDRKRFGWEGQTRRMLGRRVESEES